MEKNRANKRKVKQVHDLPLEGGVWSTVVQEVSLKYQLLGKELDMMISVTNDNDLNHMMHEYDRLYWPNSNPVRMRIFLFDQPDAVKPLPSNIDFLFGLDNHVVPLIIFDESFPSQQVFGKRFSSYQPLLPHTLSFAAVNFHHPLPNPDPITLIFLPNPNVHRHLYQEMHCLQIAQTKYCSRTEDGFTVGYAAAGANYYL
ncbi:hypothetical protein Fmac_026838 [Flemingia macrophylla]|uniref:PB1 domain-containing protein n=1 Tax=Flemingia macrophylla TaxID=520843 RepID=A0ABD1LG03_9FABA